MFKDIVAGVVTSSVSLAYCFSFGALIFAGPLQPFLGQGIAAALICGGITGTIISLKSGFPVSVSGPDSNTAALLAAMIAAMTPALAAQTPHGALFLALAALMVATLASGAALYLLGRYRLGRLGRFIPYPVLAGFQGASGWLMAAGAIRMATGIPVKLLTLPAFAGPEAALVLIVTLAWALTLWWVATRFKHPLTLPIVLAAAAAAADGLFALMNSSGHLIASAGWMFPATGGMDVALPIATRDLWHIDWLALPPVSGEVAAIILMAALTIVLNSTSIEQSSRIDVDLDHELRVQGLANVVSGLFGGLVGYISLNRTIMAAEAGAKGRLAGVVVGLVGVAALAGGLGAIGFVPRFVLGGLLFQLGFRLLWKSCVSSRKQLSTAEWLLVLIIVVTTASFGVLIGFLLGVVGGCVLFAVSVSMVGIVKHSFTIAERASSLVRSSAEMELIAAHAQEIHILQLASFIFFGSAYRLQEQLRAMIAAHAPRMVIFDFTSVSGIDSSAGSSLVRISELLRASGAIHVVICPSPDVHKVMRDAGALGKHVEEHINLDEALEYGENTLLDHHGASAAGHRPLKEWLADALGDADQAGTLIAALEPAVHGEDGYLCHAGDPTETLLFIEQGRISVETERKGQIPIRHRVFGANTVLGEVGFFLGVPRTASLRIDGAATVWALGREAYRRLSQNHPEMTAALLTYTVRIQGERLAFASQQVAALLR